VGLSFDEGVTKLTADQAVAASRVADDRNGHLGSPPEGSHAGARETAR
jgi:hypothetical protein